jgi:hypothetical protein
VARSEGFGPPALGIEIRGAISNYNRLAPPCWRENDRDADFPIKEARELMFELVGGEPAQQLRDQFA